MRKVRRENDKCVRGKGKERNRRLCEVEVKRKVRRGNEPQTNPAPGMVVVVVVVWW